jgi:hypothetical protein
MVFLSTLEGNQEFTFQQIQEQEQYLQNPLAFWLRPDGDYLTDEPYKPRFRFYDPCIHQTIEFIED